MCNNICEFNYRRNDSQTADRNPAFKVFNDDVQS